MGRDDTEVDDDPADDTGDTNAVAGSCASGQWDPWDAVEPDHCDDDGYDASVAASHFIGQFHFNGGAVSGTEIQVLYAAPEWVANGGEDCRTVWTITGSRGAPLDCVSCAYSLALQAQIDTEQTTCPNTLWGASSFSVTYNVREQAGDEAVYSFAASGEELGQGCSTDAEASYVTSARCFYF